MHFEFARSRPVDLVIVLKMGGEKKEVKMTLFVVKELAIFHRILVLNAYVSYVGASRTRSMSRLVRL